MYDINYDRESFLLHKTLYILKQVTMKTESE